MIHFAHMADCHIGAWHDPKLHALSIQAFVSAIDICIDERVDFIIIAGDLFHTSLPSIESLKSAVGKLKELKDKAIPVYLIAGSHDYSPSGKTMLDVLEKAGLCRNVCRLEEIDGKINLEFTVDEKTNAKITGILGRRRALERDYYENLNREALEKEQGFKIFVLHSAIDEIKPEGLADIESAPVSLLPRNFDYYAAGHLHYVKDVSIEGYNKIVYPGPLFPNNFEEIERLGSGGFFIVTAGDELKLDYRKVKVKDVKSIKLDCTNLSPEEVMLKLEDLAAESFDDCIVTLRLYGRLSAGRTTDIGFKDILAKMHENGAYFVMRNTAKLESPAMEEIKVKASSVQEIESALIDEHASQVKVSAWTEDQQKQKAEDLMHALEIEKEEGERVADFEKRVLENVKDILGL